MAPQAAPTNVEFQYFRIKDKVIDPSSMISLDIYESLDFPGITGRLVIEDYSDFKEVNKIFAGDKIELSFKSRGDDEVDPLTLELYIYESRGDTPNPNSTSNEISFGFCSYWLLDGFTKKRSRSWINRTIGEIIAELVHECSGNSEGDDDPFEDPLIGIFTPTSAVLERFVSPYWTPIETIQYLMRQAISEDGFGGYVLWTDIYSRADGQEKVNFMPLSKLMSNGDNYGQLPFKLEMQTTHDLSNRKIINQTVEQSFDVVKYGKTGLGRSQLFGFDYDRGLIMRSDRRIDMIEQNHLSSKLPLNKKYLGKSYRHTSYSSTYPNTTNLIRNEEIEMIDGEINLFRPRDLIKGQLQSKMAYLYADMLKINALVNGESESKRVGNLIEVVYPRVDQTAGRNNQYSGWYLIRNNRHTIQGMQYANVLTLITDGYNELDRDDMVEWNQANEFVQQEELKSDGDVADADADVDLELKENAMSGFVDLGDLPWAYGTVKPGEM